MKIAFIVNEFPSLSQTFVLNQITGLIDRGHEVDIFAEEAGKGSNVHGDVIKYKLLERTSYPLVIPQCIVRRLFNSLRYIYKFCKKKYPKSILKSLNVVKYGRNASSCTLLYQIVPILEKGPYDIVHCHFGPCGNFGALLKELDATAGKIVTAFHGYDMSKYLREHGNDVYNLLFGKGDLFLPISECWQSKLVELGCSKEKIVVHRMGIDTAKFRLVPRKPKYEEKIQLVTIGRLVEKKGVKYGILAVAEVMKRFPSLEYRIVGDGPLRDSLETLIEELKIGDCVKLVGWKQQEELVQLLREADILLAPSVTSQDGDQEGVPVVLMEALAQGVPVVSTYHSGISELVQDEKSGFLAQERDVSSLADKLEYLLMNQGNWVEMGKNGRKHVEEHYDINKLNDQLVDLFEAILNGQSK
jgi:colanic acid/amylovoran/stewartan biosynthesis glycosyltransferase WcaL/AmsK/CpsK